MNAVSWILRYFHIHWIRHHHIVFLYYYIYPIFLLYFKHQVSKQIYQILRNSIFEMQYHQIYLVFGSIIIVFYHLEICMMSFSWKHFFKDLSDFFELVALKCSIIRFILLLEMIMSRLVGFDMDYDFKLIK
jgi:hypothetical protein